MSYGFNDSVFSFQLSWEQPQAGLVKRYKLTYYEKAGKQPDIELFDMKTGKLFLKRVSYNLPPAELFLGNQVIIFARQMTIEDFGDAQTRSRFASSNLIAIVPFSNANANPANPANPTDWRQHPASIAAFLLKDVAEDRLQSKLEDVKMFSLSRTDATRLATLGLSPEMSPILQAPAVIAINIRASAGSNITRERFEGTLEASLRGNVWVPKFEHHKKAIDMVFSSAASPATLESVKRTTARFKDCSVCVVKAHAVQSGHVPEVVKAILTSGLEITAMRSVSLSRVEAGEFLEVYKGVVPNFPALVDELCRSRVVAIEVCGQDAVKRLRELAGPIDYSVAKRIRPKTIRARYGVDSVQNCVHVTDLPEDGVLESEYMFDILP